MTYLLWDGDTLYKGASQRSPQVVDSYLVQDKHVVRWDLHEKRFAASSTPEAWPFLSEVRKAIPEKGAWFPRVEWHGADNFAVALRPAPPLRKTSSLWLPESPDPRTFPTIKGPDLKVLAWLRSRAHDNGFDDALLISPDGTIMEAANAAVVFWADKKTVILPKQEVLPSITVAATLPLWEKDGITIIREDIRRIDIPAWCGSSLHGWTPVVSWGRGLGRIAAAQAPSVKPWNTQLRPFL
ncbi:aminotransferase class IV [Corynebacterium crudilactis]|uniref:Aminotransferase n=1 Tax=Corynebacterium crudilactis TaxID=1652495 RepID=A0A172QSH7_9CORY|nr:aminotransferase class IV [Corynebacterium crudilactis]ANE03618.1 hypothetical protein ccrud_04905 [Corynebacterium crudilactis]